MFEYLMPQLVMPTYEGTLLDQTCRAVVARQADYGAERGVPWGISESGYNTTDVHLNYQYRAFGVPGLGLKRGLVDDLVIAPYATVMALDGLRPRWHTPTCGEWLGTGSRDAMGSTRRSTTPPRGCREGSLAAVIRSFMAHHQGMSFLSLAYLLRGRPMQRRFESDPSVQATELLLQSAFRSPRPSIGTRSSSRLRSGPEGPTRDSCASTRVQTRRPRKCSSCPTAGTR